MGMARMTWLFGDLLGRNKGIGTCSLQVEALLHVSQRTVGLAGRSEP